MTEQEKINLACELSGLSVFRGVLKTETVSSLVAFLCAGEDPVAQADRFGAFVSSLAGDGFSFSDFLRRAVYTDENRYITDTVQGRRIPRVLAENAAAELALFSRLSRIGAESLTPLLPDGGYVPRFTSEPVDFVSEYAARLRHPERCGYGIFSAASMFRIEGTEPVPVQAADPVSLDRFVGYEEERRQVFENTRALAEGRPAANVLLFGDAGTGKSSTVKACANFFSGQGVRLIELRKDQLLGLPRVLERIAGNPLKFILFIDDLSFNRNDDSFSMLKAALEGSAAAKTSNAVIYATSNRRHIVKESFSDRSEADDIHRNDTVQELMSLSDRFGLTVYFEKPDKRLYLEIVHALAERNAAALQHPALPGGGISREELDRQAEAFALKKGNRSPRAAEQFIDSLIRRSLMQDGEQEETRKA